MPTQKDEASKKENTKSMWSQHEKDNSVSLYGCQILLEKCSLEETKNKNFPKDAYIVTYYDDGEICYDMTRSNKVVNIFDMYWDKVRGDLVSISYGNGNINPKLWGYEAPKTKKRK